MARNKYKCIGDDFIILFMGKRLAAYAVGKKAYATGLIRRSSVRGEESFFARGASIESSII
jgi:hypothetical protein